MTGWRPPVDDADVAARRAAVAERAGCTRLVECTAVLHHADCAKWVAGRPVVSIVVTEPALRRPLEPCELGAHAWAWLTAGGQECARCGRRR